MSSVSVLDVDLSHHDVQALKGPDGIAAFFARLGYDTNARTPQARKNSVLCPRNWPQQGGRSRLPSNTRS